MEGGEERRWREEDQRRGKVERERREKRCMEGEG